MTPTWKTPGVYTEEKDAFPNSVVEVPTAVPAFVGYTEIHAAGPRVVESMAEVHAAFGAGPPDTYGLGPEASGPQPVRTSPRFHLYRSLLLFYRNGGRRCAVVSVGDYAGAPRADELLQGIEVLEEEHEPALVVIPDAVLLDPEDCRSVQRAVLEHCGRTRRRMAILDIPRGWLPRVGTDPVDAFRRGLAGADHLEFGAAYYPWLETALVESTSVGLGNFDAAGRTALEALLHDEGRIPADVFEHDVEHIDRALRAASPLFRSLVDAIRTDLNRLPPSGALAGVYARVDEGRGVWVAPANVGLAAVVRPSVEITHEQQEDLNVTPTGLSVNAIRSFIGEGTLVWGARTLAGNSLDGRYVPVRRTLIMLEQSIRLVAKSMVFEANDGDTWAALKGRLETFLTDVWKQGGLAGATPDEAFGVQVGLDETMTPRDIQDGVLRMTVRVAVTRPGEFVVFTVEQPMQAS